ncbi:hypothetical protein BDF19DRAFT_438881 [Syncephalis fuscata]|nr:hypothetical protein BDF19DRAFT_438881 [Syncephalis fuscata]
MTQDETKLFLTTAGRVRSDSMIMADACKPFIIGIAGGPACGKKTVSDMVRQQLLSNGERNGISLDIVVLHQSDFYRELTETEQAMANNRDWNFDHPDSLDFDLMEQVLKDLKEGNPVTMHSYNFKTQLRGPEQQKINNPDIVLFEGTYMLYKPSVRDYLSLKVFLDIDSDTRLARRVIRDTEGRRQMPLDQVLQQYVRFVKPSFERFILPTKIEADLIVPRGSDNQVAVTLVVEHVDDVIAATRIATESHIPTPVGSFRGNSLNGSAAGENAGATLRTEPEVYTQVPN